LQRSAKKGYMKINILIPSTTSLSMKNDGSNVQGDELVARLWAKNLLADERVELVDLNSYPCHRDDYDVSISFTPLIESTGGFKVLYMQNCFPKPAWPGTVEMFQQMKSRYDGYVFPSNGLRQACGEDDGLVCQFATDLDLFGPREYSESLDHNLCFVGNRIRDAETNEKYIMCARDKGLAIYGNASGWQSELCRGKISIPDEAILYSSSKICLNSHLEEHLLYGSYNFRIFNILACGGFIISDHSQFLEDEFGECMVFTTGGKDLLEKIDYYLASPDETTRYRNAGLEKVKLEHTFQNRMNDLLHWIGERI